MKLAAMILIFGTLLSLSVKGQDKSIGMKNISTDEAKMTCKLTTTELQQRKNTIVAELKSLRLQTMETESGFKYKFDGSDKVLDLLNSFVKTERMCCDFFKFQITVEGDVSWLELSGPKGAKEFIKLELEL